ncbi:IucA/IucC family protein [Staphylococcus auricularis]|uniref:Sialic acid synthase n=1 Tax=Staphylococcus auricularis TaxID=29379 RepID=A0ABX5ID08_9STAP|nr:IucA/IucC family protein [Staphylococcus auricularis]MEB6570041.1 sialic acid synthase [Staphylococcus auricularis]PTH16728.1 sialic acid synthase [Staphylococcus auricularis]PTH24637.1 sialic acid synthase [Staphylococcus auricularis]
MSNQININDFSLELTPEEQAALDYLTQHHSTWADHFKQQILTSRDKISQRLITSIHRENLVGSRDHSQIVTHDALPQRIDSEHRNILTIEFPYSAVTLYAPITGQHAFDRIDVEGPFYISTEQQTERLLHPNQVLNFILKADPELDNAASQQFSEDMDNSIANLALALSYQTLTMKDESAPLWQLIKQAEDSYLRSEQAVVEGHPLHPGAKLRKGMSPDTVIAYSSEFAQPIQMQFILVRRDLTRLQGLDEDYNTIVYDLFEGLNEAAEHAVGAQHINDYIVMIVHPWQYDHILLNDYQTELNDGSIVPLTYQLDYFAGLSFRTLMPKYPKRTPHIKLSTNVHITGEIRTLSEQTTYNGPQVTRILNDILANDSLFQHLSASTIDERAGAHFYNDSDSAETQVQRSEQLGTLYRDNIYHLIEDDDIPMIPSSLVARYPFNDEAPIVTILKTFIAQNDFENPTQAITTWFKDYAEALLGLVVPLFVKYGIAMEAHLQNSIVTIKNDGRFNHMYIRDFEGLRIEAPQLNQMGYDTSTFHEKSLILTQSSHTVFNKAFYSTVQNHLGELVLTAAKAFDIDGLEDSIWDTIKDVMVTQLRNIRETMPTQQARLDEIERTMFAAHIDYKCVTTMRLIDEADVYTYIKVNNPLHDSSHEQ